MTTPSRPRVVRTPSQTVGPYVAIGLSPLALEEVVAPDHPDAIRVRGTVRDGRGDPVVDAAVEIFAPAGSGSVAGRSTGGVAPGFGRSLTDADGAYRFVTLKPAPRPARDGRLQAPHLEVAILARGLLQPLRTRMYFADEAAANSEDPLLAMLDDPARRDSLVAVLDPGGYRFDIWFQGSSETQFLA